jgi:hypothetical protein
MAERSSAQIQRDIERTRAEMSDTVDALERKLSPGELLDELWGRVGGGQTGANVGETIRDHPVPLALMGLGLGWLAIEKATESRTEQLRARYETRGEGSYDPADGRVGPYRGDAVDGRHDGRIAGTADAIKDRVTSIGGEMKDRVESASEGARDHISAMGERIAHRNDGDSPHPGDTGPSMGERAHQLHDRADREMRHARDSMQRRGGQLERGLRALLDDHPLALGAITFGIGLAAGAGAPSTRAEDQLMGEPADTLKEQVKATARDTSQRAREVADETVDAVRSEARKEEMAGDLKAKVERVANAAADTAKEEAKSKGLTGEAMKDRAAETGRQTLAAAPKPGDDRPIDRL